MQGFYSAQLLQSEASASLALQYGRAWRQLGNLLISSSLETDEQDQNGPHRPHQSSGPCQNICMPQVVLGIVTTCKPYLMKNYDMEAMVHYIKAGVPRWRHTLLQEVSALHLLANC